MAEYIEREALLKSEDWQSLKSDFDKARAHIIILGQPAADVAEVVHGEWKMRGGVPRCSECDEKALQKDEGGTGGFSHEYVRVKSKYRPNCGAEMDGKGIDNGEKEIINKLCKRVDETTGYEQNISAYWKSYLAANLDLVEVVRCEKCLFYKEVEYYHPTDKNPTKNVCRLFKRQMQPNDFCSYGERKCEDG